MDESHASRADSAVLSSALALQNSEATALPSAGHRGLHSINVVNSSVE